MTRPSAGGRIEVICGCMYSGKTEELIRRMRQVMIARQPCRVFTPRLDTRYSEQHVASHAGARLEAVPVSSIKEVLAGAEDIQVAAIDELHFLEDSPEEILAGCQELADRGLRPDKGAIEWLLAHGPRSFAAVRRIVGELDRASLRACRPVTTALARSVLVDLAGRGGEDVAEPTWENG